MSRKPEAEDDDAWRTQLTPGRCYLFEAGNTKFFVGRLVSVQGLCTAVLEDAAWIADTGRFSTFLRAGKADGLEVEPVGAWCVQWCGWTPWPHALFTEAI